MSFIFICCSICPKLDDSLRWKMSCLHSEVRNVLLASLKDMEETEYFLACYELHFYMLLHLSPTRWYMQMKNVLTPLRSQERPLSFLKEHGGDRVLPGMLWASFFICCFICPQLDDTCRWKMSWIHSGFRNVLLASLKDMEETEYFLPSYELHYLNAASFVPN